jgi:hypothetical protein
MGDNLAVVKKADSPSQLAFAELRKRVDADTDLPAGIKAAFLDDLKEDASATLAKVRAALGGGESQGAA